MIAIDFDGVIVNTIKMFVDLNNKLNNQNDNFMDVTGWDFHPVCKNLKNKRDVDELFKHPELYNNLQFFSEAINVIKRLNDKYPLVICTMGETDNIIHKLQQLKLYLPEINLIPIVNNDWSIKNKDMVKCDILLDDKADNLVTSSSKLPILFEPYSRYDWNVGWSGETVNSWIEFERRVDRFYGK